MRNRWPDSPLRFAALLLCAAAVRADSPMPAALPKDAVPAPVAVFNFDRDRLMNPPRHFTLAVTGEGPGIRWEVQRDFHAPSKPNILVQIGKANPGENFALAILNDIHLDHGEVAVRFKVLAGEEDQAAGIVFRYKDPQNYYVIRADGRDDTCALYRVKNGKRKPLDTKNVIVTPYTWHELRVIFTCDTYTAMIGDEPVLGGKDFSDEAGQVGLWTKADSHIAFDDLRISK